MTRYAKLTITVSVMTFLIAGAVAWAMLSPPAQASPPIQEGEPPAATPTPEPETPSVGLGPQPTETAPVGLTTRPRRWGNALRHRAQW